MGFKEWSDTAKTEQTIEVNRDTIRDVYTFPNGIKVIVDMVMPRNPFKQSAQCATVDYTVPEGDPRVLAAGGTVEQWYEEEGYGHPQFWGDAAVEKAYSLAEVLGGTRV